MTSLQAPVSFPDSPSGASNAPMLRRATVADVAQLADTLAAAFRDDPIYGWLIPSDAKRPSSLRTFFAIQLRTLGLARGDVWTSEHLVGAAITTPPGMWRLPPTVMMRNGRRFAKVFGAQMPRALAYLVRMEHLHVDGPHHYVATVGVSPEAQGQGWGTKLLRPTLDLCDARKLPAYVEATSERNAALYERLGFALTGEMRMRDSPPLRLMLRRPADSRPR